ncbi:ATP-dependent helicase [Amycolatopsis sp. GM8]|uniref:ATP-dependent helicase n=1 Tax=Amycolatopsis sp. GM8 TaxID=2896530 RepID=UPI001F31C752|nr:ATP-dependent helicase [Amycolatopsis sp. GM8]
MSALSASIRQLKTNQRQWEAFTTEGHCAVLAPPGSGKTKLLATRLAYDLANKIPRPQGAACITLTNAAAGELRQRVEDLGVEGRSTLFLGTVHGFALRRVIEPFAAVVGRPELTKITIASTRQCTQAYDQAIAEIFAPGEDTRNVRSTIEINRQRLASEHDWSLAGEKVPEVARRYEAKLRAQGLHDFLDIVAIAVEFVEQHTVVRKVLTAEYPHLYVDEYQDLAPGLDRLVRALCFDYTVNSELFAVGDPDQAVFAFTGTRPELLHDLARHSQVTPVELEHNYRCGQEIIRIANLMRRRGQVLITSNRDGGHVSAVFCPGGLSDQYVQVVNHVRSAQQRGIPLHEIAVICPQNRQCEEVANVLRNSDIQAFVRETDYRLTTVTAFVEGCAAWATLGRELSGYRLGDQLRRWRSIVGARWSQADDVALVELLMGYADQPDTPMEQLVAALMAGGLERALEQVSLADDALEMRQMIESLTSGSMRGLTVQQFAGRARKLDRVEVTTMTSSKGREFDVVLLIGADEDSIPYYLSHNNPEQLAEDRRKFYVSITRARDEVRVFYSGFVVTRYHRVIQKGPSRFLREIGLVS